MKLFLVNSLPTPTDQLVPNAEQINNMIYYWTVHSQIQSLLCHLGCCQQGCDEEQDMKIRY